MLVFLSSDCEPCAALMPSIGRWQKAFAGRLPIHAIGSGDADEYRRMAEHHGIERVLMDVKDSARLAFHARVTPSAVAIGPGGVVDGETAEGVQEVESLVRRASKSRREPVGLASERPDAGAVARADVFTRQQSVAALGPALVAVVAGEARPAAHAGVAGVLQGPGPQLAQPPVPAGQVPLTQSVFARVLVAAQAAGAATDTTSGPTAAAASRPTAWRREIPPADFWTRNGRAVEQAELAQLASARRTVSGSSASRSASSWIVSFPSQARQTSAAVSLRQWAVSVSRS